MKKTPEEKRPSPMGNVALVASAVVAVAVGGLCFWLHGRAEDAKRKLRDSIAQYETMKQVKPKLADLLARGGGPRDAKEEGDPAKIMQFLASKATQVGLPNPVMRQSNPQKSGAWSESETMVQLGATGRDSSIARGPLIDFLAAVERERPYLKSKGLTLTFAGGSDLTRAEVRISYFKRD